MIWDAVSNHKMGKLSLDVFKAHIKQTQPSFDPDAELPTRKEGELLSFSQQLPTFKQAEQLLIAEALNRSGGNQAIAALSLGISRQALNKRLQQNKQ